jgi:hypothetical protein
MQSPSLRLLTSNKRSTVEAFPILIYHILTAMKQSRLGLYLLFVSLCLTTNISAQNRTVGAQKLLLDDGGGNTVTMQYSGPGSSTFTFPNTNGANGQVLQTNGSGSVSWQNPGAGTLPSGAVVMFSGTGAQAGYSLLGPVGNEIDSWSSGTNLPVSQTQSAIAVGANGRIYVIGGSNGAQNNNPTTRARTHG